MKKPNNNTPKTIAITFRLLQIELDVLSSIGEYFDQHSPRADGKPHGNRHTIFRLMEFFLENKPK